MGLFDSVKAAANQAKQSVTTASSSTVAKLWAAHKDSVCDAILSYAAKAARSGSGYVSDDARYRAYVIDPAWDLLPLPIRMIGRQRLRWDAMFHAARSSLFVVEGNVASMHPDARQRLERLLAPNLGVGQVGGGSDVSEATSSGEDGSTK